MIKILNEKVLLDNVKPNSFYKGNTVYDWEHNIIVKLTFCELPEKIEYTVIIKLVVEKFCKDNNEYHYCCGLYECIPGYTVRDRFMFITDICGEREEDVIKDAKELAMNLFSSQEELMMDD